MKLEAGGKPWRRKPSAPPAVIAARMPASVRSSESAITAIADRRDRTDPGREPVDAVDQVDDVDHGDDADDRQRVGGPAEFEAADERDREHVGTDSADHRDGAAADLADQLDQGRQVEQVVERPDARPARAPSRMEVASMFRGSQIQPATWIPTRIATPDMRGVATVCWLRGPGSSSAPPAGRSARPRAPAPR